MTCTWSDVATWEAQLAELDAAIAAGVRQVTHGDRTITYNTTDSLLRARQHLVDKIQAGQDALASKQRPRMTRLQFGGRGYW